MVGSRWACGSDPAPWGGRHSSSRYAPPGGGGGEAGRVAVWERRRGWVRKNGGCRAAATRGAGLRHQTWQGQAVEVVGGEDALRVREDACRDGGRAVCCSGRRSDDARAPAAGRGVGRTPAGAGRLRRSRVRAANRPSATLAGARLVREVVDRQHAGRAAVAPAGAVALRQEHRQQRRVPGAARGGGRGASGEAGVWGGGVSSWAARPWPDASRACRVATGRQCQAEAAPGVTRELGPLRGPERGARPAPWHAQAQGAPGRFGAAVPPTSRWRQTRRPRHRGCRQRGKGERSGGRRHARGR
jgi:hypothetical protein